MLFRDNQDNLAASEAFSSLPSGLITLDNLDIDDWCMLYRPDLPLTPPDSTTSDCANSDCPDMDAPRWPSGYMPDRWCPGNSPEDTAYVHSAGSDAFAMFNPPQGSIDAVPAWTSHSHGSVVTDMSPSLSYTSQSTRSLNTFSDAEPFWNTPVIMSPSVPMVRNASTSSACMPTGSMPFGNYLGEPAIGYPGPRMDCAPARFVNDGTGVPPKSGRLVTGQCQDSWMPAGQASGRTDLYGMELPDRRREGSVTRWSPTQYPLAISSPQVNIPAYGTTGRPRAPTGTNVAVRSMPAIQDPIAEDFSELIDFPNEDNYQSQARSPMYPAVTNQPWPMSTSPGDTLVAAADFLPYSVDMVRSQSGTTSRRASGLAPNANNVEDGRYRTDPLYTRSPESDGLYHCPFARREQCGHAPTKLKCNYDKFIDSHLKPFRCKSAECAKQAFSSTACLLRHEREAHGLHGHGRCPHLCPVPGCERSEPGKGFPRLYNCKDHQRRAHGLVSSPAASSVTVTATSLKQQSAKAGSARKRKATPTERSVVRKPKDQTSQAGHYVSASTMDSRYTNAGEPQRIARQEPRRMPVRYAGY